MVAVVGPRLCGRQDQVHKGGEPVGEEGRGRVDGGGQAWLPGREVRACKLCFLAIVLNDDG